MIAERAILLLEVNNPSSFFKSRSLLGDFSELTE